MNIKIENPKQLGADLLVGAVAAYNKYKTKETRAAENSSTALVSFCPHLERRLMVSVGRFTITAFTVAA